MFQVCDVNYNTLEIERLVVLGSVADVVLISLDFCTLVDAEDAVTRCALRGELPKLATSASLPT